VQNVALPQPEARRAYALYAVAGLGVVVGILGLAVGLKGGKSEPVAQLPAPAPVVQPAAAMPLPAAPQKIAVELDADAPNAHVVFRRRVTPAPAQMQIGATDVVELVEVSAPGYKTQRYWLTFDRPTHLKAHLVKGAGMLEATEEETLIALGEVPAPATPAIAAAVPVAPQVATIARPAPVAAAKPVEPAPAPVQDAVAEPETAPAMAPRKIGRAAAEAEPAPAPEQIATTEPAPVTEAVPAPVVDVPNPVEPKPVEAAPLPEPVRPSIDTATVSSVIGQHRPEVLKCFAEGKKKDHGMKGTLSLQLQVDAGGKVNHIQVQSTLGSPLVAACVVKSANAWRFPSRGGVDIATVNYPFTIN
jgi:outer membrane biosynthesis protein TonB